MSNKLVKNHESQDTSITDLYKQFGLTIILCSVISFILMVFVSLMPQDYDKYNINSIFTIWGIFSILLLVMGVTLFILASKSKKFKSFIERDFISFTKHHIEHGKNKR